MSDWMFEGSTETWPDAKWNEPIHISPLPPNAQQINSLSLQSLPCPYMLADQWNSLKIIQFLLVSLLKLNIHKDDIFWATPRLVL